MEGRWRQAIDSTQGALAEYAEEVSDTVPDRDIVARVQESTDRIRATTKGWAAAVRGLLTENQIVLLPPGLQAWVTGRSDGGALASPAP